MPKRSDIETILILGSGPIVIGQACEFDYSGVQACKALRSEGYCVVLVNSNPATIMTDPHVADHTYIEPLTVEVVEKIIQQTQPDALLPTVGGQTALNLAVNLKESGVLDRYGVELIGASLDAIRIAEDRSRFKQAMEREKLPVPQSFFVYSVAEAREAAAQIGFPILCRASFTMGGAGGGIAQSWEQFDAVIERGLRASPVGELLIERSLLGWKEFELEVMRDRKDNFVVVCSIENVDPMGVHTGDSITVAPSQTLTDKEYQHLRDLACRVMHVVGVETGGSNVQFAVNPQTGETIIIEMNPRVSRSSALASKATGFPIAKIAALLAVGYTLDEIRNDITRVTPASFEPSIDYCVVKIPRWNFEKFPGADATLGPQMKSVGEVMAIGRTFAEALNKAIRGLDIGIDGFWSGMQPAADEVALAHPSADRLGRVAQALAGGTTVEEVAAATGYDCWFVDQLAQLLHIERRLQERGMPLPADLLRRAKRLGFGDRLIARIIGSDEMAVRQLRQQQGLRPSYYRVDTCAAEFEAFTPYLYSTYERGDESQPTDRKKVMILGGGPNRIGQGIEFDYCCVQACWALAELGYETIMVNCNPETVSTDYDTADRLYFEPLTLEDVLNIVELEQPEGVVVQFGGQTPINLSKGLAAAGVPIWGTDADAIDLAEDRGRFGELLQRLAIDHPQWGVARSADEALAIVDRIGYPVLVRPSFVLGGRAMQIAYAHDDLLQVFEEARQAQQDQDSPVLIDQFIEDAFEVDVDCVADGEIVVMAGVMQHIEQAGIHSGDSACVLPPYKISRYHESVMRDVCGKIGRALKVRGLMNVQFAIKDDVVYVIEVNPRASRTVPFVSKATGVPVAKIAAKVQAGCSLASLGFTRQPEVSGFFVKEVVLPFNKLPGADTRLGPEMRSTGEVMGFAEQFGLAFAKAQLAAGSQLPTEGGVLITVNDFDKSAVLRLARDLYGFGFTLYATSGTAAALQRIDVPVTVVRKFSEGGNGEQLNTVSLIADGKVALVINTPLGKQSFRDGDALRAAAVRHSVTLLTTLSAAQAAVNGIRSLRHSEMTVRSLQAHHGALA